MENIFSRTKPRPAVNFIFLLSSLKLKLAGEDMAKFARCM